MFYHADSFKFDVDTLKYFANITEGSEDPFSMAASTILSGEVQHRSALVNDPVPESHFDLMGLPIKIRLLIYEQLLIAKPATHRPNSVMFKIQRGQLNKSVSELQPNILRVSKQVLLETAPMLYALNAFEFDNTAAMLLFLKVIGKVNCRNMRNISILRINQRNQAAGQSLGDCFNLTTLLVGAPRWNLNQGTSGMKLSNFIKEFMPILRAMDNGRADGVDFFGMFGFISDFCMVLRRPIFNDGGPVVGAQACACTWCVEYHECIRLFKEELAKYDIPRPLF